MKNFKKLISVILAVMMIMSVMPVGATESAGGAGGEGGAGGGGTGGSVSLIPTGAIKLFEETFDSGYTLDENWIADANKTTDISVSGATSYTVNDHTWDIQVYGTPTDDFVGVESVERLAEEGITLGGSFTGNALRLYNTRGAEGLNKKVIAYRRNFDKLNGISLAEGEYAGKLLVYEMDIMGYPHTEGNAFPGDMIYAPNISFDKAPIYSWGTYYSILFRGDETLQVTEANYNNSPGKWNNSFWKTQVNTNSSKKYNSPRKLRIVFDGTSEKDHIRIYTDDELLKTTFSSTEVPDHPRKGQTLYDFAGYAYKGIGNETANLTHYGIWGTSAGTDLYIDNFTAYLIDPFVVENVEGASTVFSTDNDAVTYTFSTPVNPATVDGNITLTDAEGNLVTGGIDSAILSNDGYTLTVKLSEDLLGLTKYTVNIGLGLSDIYGNCISPEYSWYDTYTPAANSGVTDNGDGTVTVTSTRKTQQVDCYLKDAYKMSTAVDVTIAKGVFDAGTPVTNYDIGDEQEVELKFNYPLAEVDLTDVFKVVDENGDTVTGNLNATFGETQDIIKVQLSGLNLGDGKHTITNKPNTLPTVANANLYAKVRYTFDTIDYDVSWSEESGIQYIEGTDKELKLTLTTPTVLDQTNIDTAFKIKDVSGELASGLVADIDATGKVITLQLSGLNLEVGKYYISTTSALKDRRGRTLNTSYMIRSVTEISNQILLFEEDFETGYETDQNWVTADATDAAYQMSASEGGTWTISYAKSGRTYTESNPNPNVIQIVDGTNKVDRDGQLVGFDGNVLQITGGTSTSDTSLSIRRDVPGGSIDFNDPESPYYKKQLIYEFDFFIEKGGTETTFMGYNQSKIYTLSGRTSYFSNSTYAGESSSDVSKNWWARATISTTKKHHVKVIVDPSGAVDSTRYFLDGKVVTAEHELAVDDTYSNFGRITKDFVGTGYTGQASSPLDAFEGITTRCFTEIAGGTSTYYIDNLKAYLVEAIECTGFEVDADNLVDDFNPSKGVTLKFSDKVDKDELKANLVVKDNSGTAFNNAIRFVGVSEDGTSALVKFDFTKLEANTHYTVSIGEDFYSKEGAIFANQFKGVIEVFGFTTCDKINATVVPSIITDYDKGVHKTVTITLTNPLRDGVDPNAAFVVTDANEDVVTGLSATISEDRKTITLQLSGLELGDGQHYISSKDEVFADEEGTTVIGIVVKTVDFKLDKVNPVSGTIKDYVEGTEEKIKLVLTTTTTLAADDIATGFEVVDKNGKSVKDGLIATLFADNKTIELDLSDLNVGIGEHTIKSTDKLVDARGRQLALDYKFTVLPFTASYDAEVTGYEPGTDKTVEISLTYPLNDATISSINNSFIVKNENEQKVTGLKATMSEDKKVIKLALKDLDITGGTYTITSKAGALVDIKGETLAENISFKLITASAGGSIGGNTSGQAPGTGSESHPDFSEKKLVDESFDSYNEIMGIDWMSNAEVIPNKFQLSIVGERFSDASVSIEEDPANPGSGNMVLKNVSGFYGMTGNVLAQAVSAPANYHVVQRNLEDGSKETIPVDEHTIVRVSTKVYIPQESVDNIPATNSDARTANYIFAATGGADYTPITPANFAKTTASALFHSQIPAADSADQSNPKNQIIKRVLTADSWHTIEFIFGVNPGKDTTKNDRTFASYEVLIDGTSVDNEVGKYFAATYSTIGGMVSKIIATSAGRGPVTVYYDDWKITQETRFATHVNISDTKVKEDAEIKLTFTKDLDSASMQLIKDQGLATLTDEKGNKVEATITYSGNNKITITPTYGLKYQTKYVVQIASEANVNGAKYAIKAADGEAFGGLTYAFETAKALSTHIDTDASTSFYYDENGEDAEYLADATSFTYNMQLSGQVPENGIIAAVATFDGKDELLGIKYETILQSDVQPKNFALSSPKGTKSFRMYIWERIPDGNGGFKMGRLMQLPDEITSR